MCFKYLVAGSLPPPKYTRGGQGAVAVPADSRADWTRVLAASRTGNKFQRRKQRRRKRKKAVDEWSGDDTSDEDFEAVAPRNTSGVVRRSSRQASQTKKKYTFDDDEVEELLKHEEEEEQAGARSDSPARPAKPALSHILGVRFAPDAAKSDFDRTLGQVEFLVKFKMSSYLHVEWLQSALVKEYPGISDKKMRGFLASPQAQEQLDEDEQRERDLIERKRAAAAAGHPTDGITREYRENSEYFDSSFLEIDRILASKVEEYVVPETGGGGGGGGADGADGGRPPTGRSSSAASGSGAGAGAGAGSGAGAGAGSGGTSDGGAKQSATMYLVKWAPLGYLEATWEWAEDVKDAAKIGQFMRFSHPPDLRNPHPAMFRDVRPPMTEWAKYAASPAFKNGLVLRDYQLEGLNWLVFNWYQRRNCILADEMGLGKTIQSLSFLHHLLMREHVRGPFMVLAPLSTIPNWKREVEDWTDMNVIVYHDVGGSEGRKVIREREFRFDSARHTKKGLYKFNIMVTTYQTLLSDWEDLTAIHWRALVIDEAHNLRNRNTMLQQCVKTMSFDTILLLTGTPVHNNMQELWTLLNIIDPHHFARIENFLEAYGGLRDAEQLAKLQADLRPLLLRRIKEDVEKTIPAKEETVIHVELTTLQKKYYRAIFDRNRSFLNDNSGGSNSVAQLVNIEMELRKVCNHPFLIRGLEQREQPIVKFSREEFMVQSCGKMVLLDKLLAKLRTEKHKVLVFSQFAMMLDVLHDFCEMKGYPVERLDGSVHSSLRQASIDRFNKRPESFIFLLTTRAGGVGINLTAADTVVIYDSDWNPQNDLQAISRCHRIGQTNMVRIYRLVTNRTYEAEMFRRAGKKLGLHQAVFESGGITARFVGGRGMEDEGGGGLAALAKMDKDKVETLLRFGAYALLDDDSTNADRFYSQNIDQILDSSTTTIRYEAKDEAKDEAKTNGAEGAGAGAAGVGSGAGGGGDAKAKGGVTFNKATFAASTADEKLDIKDPEFWKKVLGPKPTDRLFALVRDGNLATMDKEELFRFLREAQTILEEMISKRASGKTHEDQATMELLLIELKVRGKGIRVPPFVAQRINSDVVPTLEGIALMWNKALKAATRRRRRGRNPNLIGFDMATPIKRRRRAAAVKPDYTEDSPVAPRRVRVRNRKKKPSAPAQKKRRIGNGDSVTSPGDGAGSGGAVSSPAATSDAAPATAAAATPGAGAGAASVVSPEPPASATFCRVCHDEEGYIDNPIVLCDGCDMPVHQYCYGIEEVPTGDLPWYCTPCKMKAHPVSCALCPHTGGAFKLTEAGEYVHAICALWCPLAEYGSLSTLEPVIGIERIRASPLIGVCEICRGSGVLIQCCVAGCPHRIHAICGRRHGKRMEMGGTGLVMYCDEHR